MPIKVVLCDIDDGPRSERTLSALFDSGYSHALVYVRSGREIIDAVDVDLEASDPSRLFDQLRSISTRNLLTPAPTKEARPQKLISIIVPTLMERRTLLRSLLESLKVLNYRNLEIIVVHNRTGTLLKEPYWVNEYAQVRVVQQPVPGIAAARNCGVLHAQGEIIAFTDDDARVDPNWLSMLAARFESDPNTDCVTGIGLPDELETASQLWFEHYYGGFSLGLSPKTFRLLPGKSGPGKVGGPEPSVGEFSTDGSLLASRPILIAAGSCGAGVNMAFRRDALESIGPFDESLGAGTRSRGGEEISAFARLLWKGGKITYDPRAVVWHTHRRTYEELLRQVTGTGVSITAAFTSLALSDRRLAIHLLTGTGAGHRVIKALGSALRAGSSRPRKDSPSRTYPSGLRRAEVQGMLKGPFAYLHESHMRRE